MRNSDPWAAARAAATPRARAARVAGRLGPYQILAPLGQGAFGDVYRARDARSGREVAVKVLTRATPRARERFRREVEATGRLRHPGIVTLLDSDLAGEPPYMVMELVGGVPFTEWCESTLPVALRERVRVVQEVAVAVQAAHEQGVLHRDLKPDNVLVDAAGRARVVDFGLARLRGGRSSLTRTGDVVGTPAYMAPEQAGAHEGQVDVRTDVYALGATLYHALTGAPPFDGRSPVEVFMALLGRDPTPPSGLAPEVPQALDAICLRCLAKDPSQRYPAASDVADDLGRWLRGEGPRLSAAPLTARLSGWLRAYRLPLLTGVLGLVLGGVLVAGVVLYARGEAPRPDVQVGARDPAPPSTPPPRLDAHREDLQPVPARPPAANDAHENPGGGRPTGAPPAAPDREGEDASPEFEPESGAPGDEDFEDTGPRVGPEPGAPDSVGSPRPVIRAADPPEDARPAGPAATARLRSTPSVLPVEQRPAPDLPAGLLALLAFTGLAGGGLLGLLGRRRQLRVLAERAARVWDGREPPEA